MSVQCETGSVKEGVKKSAPDEGLKGLCGKRIVKMMESKKAL